MPLPGSGQITLDQIHQEAGGSTETSAGINDADIRSLIGASSEQNNLSFADFYGASARTVVVLSINNNMNNYNIYTNRTGSYVAGQTDVQLYINSAAAVGSTSTGLYALDTGTGWASGDTIGIINNGTVKGRGGNGGNGGSAAYNSSVGAGSAGGTGGPAFRAQFACSVTNNGSFYGGGGGGGGGGSDYKTTSGKTTDTFVNGGSGGGGGAGIDGGTGGSGGSATGGLNFLNNVAGATGNNGSATAGGAAQTSGVDGGAGGGLGSNGTAGANGTTGSSGATDAANGGSGGTRGFYQVGLSLINGGSGIGGTVGGRSS